jgi:meso-butanediol dehydrogenase/(S,S)-butanediol dehydrogenase/diacetyl reductase
MRIEMTVEGKVAVVTGAGQGIGQGIVHCLAEEGADMAVIDINGGNARKFADEVKGLGRQSLAVEVALTDNKKVTQVVQDIIDTFGKIDILVNNVDGGMVTI